MFFPLNLHPAIVHFPISLLLLASCSGLVYMWAWPRQELALFTWWLMLLGWLGAAAAVLTGLVAQSGLSPVAPFRSLLNWHIGTGIALVAVYGFLLYRRWLFGSQRSRRQRENRGVQAIDLLDDPGARFWLSLLLLVGALLVIASGWNGGRLVYEWGVNVKA